MGSKVEDSSYLNALQNLVNKWIKEIQKVTRMDRDPSVGTALQEVTFWLNLERALLNIQVLTFSEEKLKSFTFVSLYRQSEVQLSYLPYFRVFSKM